MDHLYAAFYVRHEGRTNLTSLASYPKLVYTEGEAITYAEKRFKSILSDSNNILVIKFYEFSHKYEVNGDGE